MNDLADAAATGEGDAIFANPVFSLPGPEKRKLLLDQLTRLTDHHSRHCTPYRRVLASTERWTKASFPDLESLPYLHVRLFKEFLLLSAPEHDVVKRLTSSGTSGPKVSRIWLDGRTASYQTRALVLIMQHFLGKARLPMLIVDQPAQGEPTAGLSARRAGILGLSNFGRDHTYLLADDLAVDFSALERFIERHAGKPLLVFGFTFMVWEYLCQALRKANRKVDLSSAILVHSGGWKKLQDQAVDGTTFRHVLRDVTGITRVHNFYGMVEQVGSVFVECEHGYLHAPVYADVLARDPVTWGARPFGESGILQIVSVLPWSYPGHSLLTEDVGTIVGEDDCPCGRKGRYFTVAGRIPSAELRGCSDTFDPIPA